MIPPGALSTPRQQRIGGAFLAAFTALLGVFLLFAFFAEAADGSASSAAPALPFGLSFLCLSVGFGRMSATAYGEPTLTSVSTRGFLPYVLALAFVGLGLVAAYLAGGN
ncbi:MAG TPA: hypothetical protein VMZ00_16360 [Sporichthya sp.]|nr:hypothetical protein [Sporichthya sp.]